MKNFFGRFGRKEQDPMGEIIDLSNEGAEEIFNILLKSGSGESGIHPGRAVLGMQMILRATYAYYPEFIGKKLSGDDIKRIVEEQHLDLSPKGIDAFVGTERAKNTHSGI